VTTSAARARTISIALVLGFLALTHLLALEPGERAELQYRVVIAIGWGHLLAALGRRRRRGRHDWRAWALGLSVASWLFALYAALLEQWPGWVVVALAISTWHTVENDRALSRAATRGLALEPLPRRPREHLLPLGATAFVGLLALGTQDGAALLSVGGVGPLLPTASWSGWLGLADLFVVVTLHHLLTWLLLALERLLVVAREEGRAAARPLLRWLLLTHLPPMLLCGMLAVVSSPALDPLRALLLAPGVYLFWSVLHVGQTSWARGLEARGLRARR
jgi:hypothetical protein